MYVPFLYSHIPSVFYVGRINCFNLSTHFHIGQLRRSSIFGGLALVSQQFPVTRPSVEVLSLLPYVRLCWAISIVFFLQRVYCNEVRAMSLSIYGDYRVHFHLLLLVAIVLILSWCVTWSRSVVEFVFN